MGKLDNIPKKTVFDVPDGYFESLPAQIQLRIAQRSGHVSAPVRRYALRLALPILVLAAAVFYYVNHQASPESILASVETPELILFLQESEMTTEDLIENFDFSTGELEALEDEVYDLEVDNEALEVELNNL